MEKKLRVRVVGDASVPDYEALERGVRRFIGRRMQEHREEGEPVRHVWAPTDEVCEVPNTVEYRRHLTAGDLEPADVDTAKLARVEWKQGGERHGTMMPPGHGGEER